MANELNTVATAGLTITASLLQGVTVVASGISIAATAVPRYYSGSVPGNTPAGFYTVLFTDGTRSWVGELRWDGAAEVLPASVAAVAALPTTAAPTAAAVASQVRTELATELARMDVAVSTRSTYAGADTAGTATLLARMPGAVLLAANYSAAPPAGSIADAVWSATVRTITDGGSGGGGGATAAEVAAAVLDATAGDGTVRDAITRVNEVPGTGPVIVIPGAPAQVGICRVYGYFETIDNRPAVGVKLEFSLEVEGAVASERLLSRSKVMATTDAQGRLANASGDPWLDLTRNDQLVPALTWYEVTSEQLNLFRHRIRLVSDLADLRALLFPA